MSVNVNDDRPVDLTRLIMLAAAFAVAVSVILIGAYLAYGWFAQRTNPETQAPICYWADEANYTPRNDSIPLRGAPGANGERSVDQRNDQTSEEKLTEAEVALHRARDRTSEGQQELRMLAERLKLDPSPASEPLSAEQRQAL